MAFNLSGFAKGLASQDPAGFYLQAKEHELRKRQADNAQQEFEWRKEDQANKREYANATSDAISRVGTPQYASADTNAVDDGVASTDRAAYQGVPTEYTRSNMYQDVAKAASKVNPILGFEFLDKQREEQKREDSNKFFGAMARYKQSGDATDLAGVFNEFAGVYNTDKRFKDGKFAAFSAVPARTGNAGAEGIPLADAGTGQGNTHAGVALSILDTNTGKNSQHILSSEDEMQAAYLKAMAHKYPEEVSRYMEFMDKLKQRAAQDRTISATEKRADVADKQAETEREWRRSQERFNNGRLLNEERRLGIMDKQAAATAEKARSKEELGWHGMNLKERQEYMKDNSGAWSIPSGNGDATYSEHPQGRALFSALADKVGADQAMNVMAGALVDIKNKASLVPGAVDDKGYVDPRAVAHAADFVYSNALNKLRNSSGQQGKGVQPPAKQPVAEQQPAPRNNFPSDGRAKIVGGVLVNPNGVKEAPQKPDISPEGLRKKVFKTNIDQTDAETATKYLR